MSEKTEKNYTVKNIKSEIARVEKSIEKKREKLNQLWADIKVEEKQLKELKKTSETLNNAELQKQITEAWFKKSKLTGEQISKILEISDKISDKIDNLDVGTAVNAISQAYDEKKREKTDSSAESGTTSSAMNLYTRGFGGTNG